MFRIAFVVASLCACAADEPPPAGYAPGLGTPGNPVPSDGSYKVKSHVNLPLGVPAVTTAIGALTAFAQGGGAELITQGAGTPALAALNTLPSTLQTKLAGWIDLELDKQKLGTLTARQAIGDMGAMAQTVVDHFTVESALTISPTGATQNLQDLGFSPESLDVVVPIGGYMADTLDQHTTATVSAGGALAIGDQKFGLAFGSHAWQGLNLAVMSRYNGDLTIIEQLNCDAVAQAVAARCVSTTCVGHTSDLVALCQHGLTSLVDHLRDALAPVELGTFRFTSGSAQLLDDHMSGVANRITGTWNAEIHVGADVRMTQVMFDATE